MKRPAKRKGDGPTGPKWRKELCCLIKQQPVNTSVTQKVRECGRRVTNVTSDPQKKRPANRPNHEDRRIRTKRFSRAKLDRTQEVAGSSPASSIPENLKSHVRALRVSGDLRRAWSPNVWAGWSAAPLRSGGTERICVDGLVPGTRTRDMGAKCLTRTVAGVSMSS